MQIGAVWCNLARLGDIGLTCATCCNLVQLSVDWCNSMQIGAVWCNLVEIGAILCNLV